MLSCYVLQEVPLPLNSNIGCFEMKRSRERRSGKTWLNSNIGCFEIFVFADFQFQTRVKQ